MDDLLANAQIVAYECAKRWKPERGPFENYLAGTLSRELRFDSREAEPQEVGIEAADAAQVAASASQVGYEPISLAEAIERLPLRYRGIGRMRFVDKRAIGYIAAHTKRNLNWVRKHLAVLERTLGQFHPTE